MTVFNETVHEYSWAQTVQAGGKDTSASIIETTDVDDGLLQFAPLVVDETIAATDTMDGIRPHRVDFAEFDEAVAATDEQSVERIRRSSDNYGGQLIDDPITSFIRSAADLQAGHLLDINAELIIDTWDPYATFHRNLPFLAWAYDTNLWETGWSEETQREWVSRQHEFKSIRGTIAAIEMALDFVGRDFVGYGGYLLKQYMTPPQGFFFSQGLTVEEHNAWIRLMPELRIYLGSEQGHAGADFFWDDGFFPEDGVPPVDVWAYDNGWELYGRKAILRQEGQETINLKVIQRKRITENYETVDWEEITTQGVSETGFFWGHDFWAGDQAPPAFWDSEEIEPQLYNVRLDRSFDRLSTELHLSSIVPSQTPINVTYERTSDIGTIGPWFFWDHGFWNVDFFHQDEAALMLADRLFLLDESISVPMSVGTSYWDIDRWGFPKHTMELLIDLQTFAEEESYWEADLFWDDFFWKETNLEHVDRACRAVVAAKSLRDKALCQFDPWRPLRASDYITEETSGSDWVPNNL